MGQLPIQPQKDSMLTAPSLHRNKTLAAIAFLCVLSSLRAQDPVKLNTDAYLNPGLPLAQRVDDLVGRMTLEEKVSQMQNEAPAIPRLHVAEYDWWNEGLHGVAR